MPRALQEKIEVGMEISFELHALRVQRFPNSEFIAIFAAKFLHHFPKGPLMAFVKRTAETFLTFPTLRHAVCIIFLVR